MIRFRWNEHLFSIIQYGYGVFMQNMTGHSHSINSYELHYIVGGEGELITDSKRYPLKEGCFFVTGPNVYHQQITNPARPLQEIYIYLQASGEKTNDALVSAFLSTHFFLDHTDTLAKIFWQILAEEKNKHFGYQTAIGALLQYLLTQITRLYVPNFRVLSGTDDDLNDRRFLLIETAFINDPENLTLDKLSVLIGLCQRQTQRLLRKYYGMSFTEKKKEAIQKQT